MRCLLFAFIRGMGWVRSKQCAALSHPEWYGAAVIPLAWYRCPLARGCFAFFIGILHSYLAPNFAVLCFDKLCGTVYLLQVRSRQCWGR